MKWAILTSRSPFSRTSSLKKSSPIVSVDPPNDRLAIVTGSESISRSMASVASSNSSPLSPVRLAARISAAIRVKGPTSVSGSSLDRWKQNPWLSRWVPVSSSRPPTSVTKPPIPGELRFSSEAMISSTSSAWVIDVFLRPVMLSCGCLDLSMLARPENPSQAASLSASAFHADGLEKSPPL